MLSGIQICLVIAETGHAMTLPGRSETYADDCKRRGFPVDIYRGDRIGLVLAFWAVALALGRVQVSQTDYTEDGTTFGSVLNHVHCWSQRLMVRLQHPARLNACYASCSYSLER